MPRRPMIEVCEPRLLGGNYVAAARIALPGGGFVDILARAPRALVARYVAQLSAYAVWRRASKRPASFVAGEVGGFWEKLGKTVASVTKTPAFKGIMKTATSAIPFVGPVIAATGVTDMAIDAASGAVESAIAKKEARGKVRAVAQAARSAPSPRVRKKAKKVHKVMKRAALAYRKGGKRTLIAFRGIARAHDLAKRAEQGEPLAQQRAQQIADLAEQGDMGAIEALAYMLAARQAEMCEPDEELEADDELEADGFDPYGEEVGAPFRMRLNMTDRELAARLRGLQRLRRGVRMQWHSKRRAA